VGTENKSDTKRAIWLAFVVAHRASRAVSFPFTPWWLGIIFFAIF
jgi:hypothetical protein